MAVKVKNPDGTWSIVSGGGGGGEAVWGGITGNIKNQTDLMQNTNRTWYTTTAPASPRVGDLWVTQEETPQVIDVKINGKSSLSGGVADINTRTEPVSWNMLENVNYMEISDMLAILNATG